MSDARPVAHGGPSGALTPAPGEATRDETLVASGTLAVSHTGPTEPGAAHHPLVLVHGFTQNVGTWGPLRRELAADRAVVAVDLPGHGASSHITADLWETAHLLARVEPGADHLGYSLGARACLHLALAHPEAVRRLVLIGATPGISDPDARAKRRRSDRALADRIDTEPLADFLARWLAQPLFRTLPSDAAHLAARLVNTPGGLARSLRHTGTGEQEPLWERLETLDMPVLVVAGALDFRFAAIASAMADAIGANASVSLVPGSGHACHLERPAYVARLVRSFLR